MSESVKGTILIVEDEAELRFVLTENLRVVGYKVISVIDGLQAIDSAMKHQPDVIIMDIGLPTMDGITATRLLKAN